MPEYLCAIACLGLSLLISAPTRAVENTTTGDPCSVTVCMWGQVTGNSPEECRSAVQTFFSLNVFDEESRFSPGKTLDRRKQFLGECPEADPGAVSQILSRYGKIKG